MDLFTNTKPRSRERLDGLAVLVQQYGTSAVAHSTLAILNKPSSSDIKQFWLGFVDPQLVEREDVLFLFAPWVEWSDSPLIMKPYYELSRLSFRRLNSGDLTGLMYVSKQLPLALVWRALELRDMGNAEEARRMISAVEPATYLHTLKVLGATFATTEGPDLFSLYRGDYRISQYPLVPTPELFDLTAYQISRVYTPGNFEFGARVVDISKESTANIVGVLELLRATATGTSPEARVRGIVSQGHGAKSVRVTSGSESSSNVEVKDVPLDLYVAGLVTRKVPVRDPETGQWVQFNDWARAEAKKAGMEGTPFERDPVGATISLLVNPSEDNIRKVLGLDKLGE